MNDYSDNLFPAIVEGQIGDHLTRTVRGRDLHRSLNVGRDFATWIKERIEAYSFKESSDFVIFPETGEKSGRGRPSKEYALTLDMAKELAMVEMNEEGRRVRRHFIACERLLHDAVKAAAFKLDAEARKEIGGIVKSVVHYEVSAMVPAMVQGELAAKAYMLRQGKTAGQIWAAHNFARIKITSWFSNRLVEQGCMTDGKTEVGGRSIRLFDPDKADKWLRNGGRLLVEQKLAERRGQGVLRLVPPVVQPITPLAAPEA